MVSNAHHCGGFIEDNVHKWLLLLVLIVGREDEAVVPKVAILAWRENIAKGSLFTGIKRLAIRAL
eukprot:6203334-Pleurochrysis_carterae.AAC.5